MGRPYNIPARRHPDDLDHDQGECGGKRDHTAAADLEVSPGGLGAISKCGRVKDAQLMIRALENDYPLTPGIRRLIVRKNAKALKNATTPRDIARASTVLLAADKLNMQRAHGPRQDQHLHIHNDGPSEKPASLNELRDRLAERRRLRLEAQQAAEQATGQGADSVAFGGIVAGGVVANPAQALPQVIDTTCSNPSA